MILQEGYFYHISDDFFSEIRDPSLMSDREAKGCHPCFFAIRDMKNRDIFWMVPVSSRYEKYKAFYETQIARYHRCTKVVLGSFAGTDQAFPVQNAFPVTADYFDHIHTRFGSPARISEKTSKEIIQCLRTNLSLHRKGISLFFADIDRIYAAMEARLEARADGPSET